jgi:uncharacterized glyoxalase superfamily protein PhnB
MHSAKPFLRFEGNAEEAMTFMFRSFRTERSKKSIAMGWAVPPRKER